MKTLVIYNRSSTTYVKVVDTPFLGTETNVDAIRKALGYTTMLGAAHIKIILPYSTDPKTYQYGPRAYTLQTRQVEVRREPVYETEVKFV